MIYPYNRIYIAAEKQKRKDEQNKGKTKSSMKFV